MLETRSHQTLQTWQSFLNTPLKTTLQQQLQLNPETTILEHFHTVATTVPAYKAFLQTQNINPASIQSWSDFQQLPLTTKDNYLWQHALPQLCRNGQLEQCDMIAVSSGSTGQPSFWARSLPDELLITTRFEQIFHDSFQADRRRTLAVICFALGTWVGGMFTATCCRHLASKGYPITTIRTQLQRLNSEFTNYVPPMIKPPRLHFIPQAIQTTSRSGLNIAILALRDD
jgi:phenylacetate-CoA ligase